MVVASKLSCTLAWRLSHGNKVVVAISVRSRWLLEDLTDVEAVGGRHWVITSERPVSTLS